MSISTNKFNIIAIDSDSDSDSDIELNELEQIDKSTNDLLLYNDFLSCNDFLLCGEKSLTFANMEFMLNIAQECIEEPEIIIEVKKRLLKILVQTLTKKVKEENFRSVYTTDCIFNLLSELPIFNFIKEVGVYSEGAYHVNSQKLFQYKFYQNNINICAFASSGTCAFCDSDILLEEEILDAPIEIVLEELEQDLRIKFLSLKFFLDFNDACEYIQKQGNNLGINTKMKFIQNSKTIEKKREKKQKVMDEKRFPNQQYPKRLVLGDFLHPNLI